MTMKAVTVKEPSCDVDSCGKYAVYHCFGCLRDFCHDHTQTQHGNGFEGQASSGIMNYDGYLCAKCFDKATLGTLNKESQELFMGYDSVKKLRDEYKNFKEEWCRRAQVVDERITILHDKFDKRRRGK